MRTWFITGGTPGGFGMAYADAALETGDRVVLTARRPEQLREWARPHGDRVLVLPLDVTDAAQVRAAVAAAERHFDGIDVLVNNAGRGWYGSIEGMAEDAVRRTFELNFFALLAVTRAVLPGMRERRSGWILNMSSVAGLRSVTGFGYYSAAKHAVEAVTAALREEVAPRGPGRGTGRMPARGQDSRTGPVETHLEPMSAFGRDPRIVRRPHQHRHRHWSRRRMTRMPASGTRIA